MARPFSYPEVAALEVGQHALVSAPVSEVRRKVTLYGARNRKYFSVAGLRDEGGHHAVRVTRLPDPEPLMLAVGDYD